MRNKILSGLLSVVLAFSLWLYVITYVSSGSEETYYNIPVVFEGEVVLNERGMMLSSAEKQTITLVLSGNRSDLSKVNSGNITVKASLTGIYEPGENIELDYTISYPGDVPSNAFVEESRNPETVKVSVEKLVSNKEIPVVVRYNGTSVPEGFMCDKENAELDHDVVLISGPGSVADLISQAVVEVDLTDKRESISEDFRYTLCDAEGNPIDAEAITVNTESVHLDLRIRRVKEVALKVNLVYGGGVSPENVSVSLDYETIRVSGGEAVLDSLGDEIVIGTINMAELERSQEVPFPITLPEGVTNETGITEVIASVRLVGVNTREMSVSNIHIQNVPEGMEVDLITQKLTVIVRGPTGPLSLLSEEDITAYVDFSGAEEGIATFKVTIVFSDLYPKMGAVGTYSVSATVTNVEG